MIEHSSSICAKKIISLGRLEKQDEDVLKYGCELAIMSIVGIFALIVISIILGKSFAWFFFLLGFVALRTTAGGYHAESRIGCYSTTGVMFIISCCCNWEKITYLSISVLTIAVIFLLSPVAARNKPLSVKIAKKNRKRSLCIAVMYTAISSVCFLLTIKNKGLDVLYSGLLFASISIVIGKIKAIFTRS